MPVLKRSVASLGTLSGERHSMDEKRYPGILARVCCRVTNPYVSVQ